MRSDCHICLSEGFSALTRLMVHHDDKSIIATLNVVQSDILNESKASLSVMAMKQLDVTEGDLISVSHLKQIEKGKNYWKNCHREWREEFIYFIMVDKFHDNVKRCSSIGV